MARRRDRKGYRQEEEMTMQKKLAFYLALNLLVVILETIAFTLVLNRRGSETFQYYTQLSNLFLFICSIVNIVFIIRALAKKTAVPHFINLLTYMATCTTTVTLVVVLFILSWMVKDLWWLLTYDSMLYMHTLCPILAIVMLFFFAPERQNKKSALFALIPTIIYAIVGIIMNILRLWDGPYPFLQVYNQPIWASFGWGVIILGSAYLIARLLLLPIRAAQSQN